MFCTPPNRLISPLLLAALAAQAQPATRLAVDFPSPYVLAGRSATLSVESFTESGASATPQLQFTSANAAVAAVSPEGLVSGRAPGVTTITVEDQLGGARADLEVRVLPLRIEFDPASPELRLGETLKLTAHALDADGRVISGQRFLYQSANTGVLSASADGMMEAKAEGSVSITAALDAPGANGLFGYSASVRVRILRGLDYRLRRVLSSTTRTQTRIVGFSSVTAANGRTAFIASLANGGSAAVLRDNGQLRVLVTAGETLAVNGRVVTRINRVALNSQGDVAVVVEYPAEWCASAILIYRRGVAEPVEAAAACYVDLWGHALADNGTLYFRMDDSNQNFWVRQANGVRRLIVSTATDSTVQNLDAIYGGRSGRAIVQVRRRDGSVTWDYFDGTTLKQVWRVGQTVDGLAVIGIESAWNTTADGAFWARCHGSGFTAVCRVGSDGVKIVARSNQEFGTVRLGWFHGVMDGGDAGALVVADLWTGDKNNRSLAITDGKTLTPLAPSNWAVSQTASLLSKDEAVSLLELDGGLPLASAKDGKGTTLLAAGTNLPGTAPLALDWNSLGRGMGGSSLISRGTGDTVVRLAGAEPETLIAPGTKLPTGGLLVTLGSVAASRAGHVVFSAWDSQTNNGLFLWKDGVITTLAATNSDELIQGRRFGWADLWRAQPFFSVNSRGQVAFIANYGGLSMLVSWTAGARPEAVAIGSSPAPTGGGTLGSVNWTSLDEEGRITYGGTRTDGRQVVYHWDRKENRLLARAGDRAPNGVNINSFAVASAGGRNAALLMDTNDGPVISSFDASVLTPLAINRRSVLAGRMMTWSSGNRLGAAGNGDVFFAAQTGDGLGLFAARGGAVQLVARVTDALADGSWLITALGLAGNNGGELYFGAHVYQDGKESLAVYQATPVR